MRSSRADDELSDLGAAATARFPRPPIDPELVLVAPRPALRRPVEGVEGRSLVLDGGLQHLADRGVQPDRGGAPDGVGAAERMDARLEERFVDVDIAEPGEERLVEKQRLDLPLIDRLEHRLRHRLRYQ